MTMLLSSDKLVIMKIVTCALVTIFIITRLSDDNITLYSVYARRTLGNDFVKSNSTKTCP